MTFKIAFGPVTLAWNTDDRDPRFQEFHDAYAAYVTDRPADVTVTASVIDTKPSDPEPILPNSFMRAREVRGDTFILGENLVIGTLANERDCRCEIHPVLLSGCGLRVLEQFFYLMFQHAVRLSDTAPDRTPFLLHCCAARGPEGALLFSGPSGSGKSTIASLCPAGTVLTDECAIITPGDGGYSVSGSPVNPTFTAKVAGSAPLSRIYLISHGEATRIGDISSLEAVPRLTAEIMVPVGLLETDMELAMTRALDTAIGLMGAAAVKALAFRPDGGITDIVTGKTGDDTGDGHADG